jgi:hypothetical protein
VVGGDVKSDSSAVGQLRVSASAHEFAEVGVGLAFNQQLGNALLDGRQFGGIGLLFAFAMRRATSSRTPSAKVTGTPAFALMDSAGMDAEFRESLGAVLRMLGGAASYTLGC